MQIIGGSDSFTLSVSDGSATDTLLVNLTIESVNDAPINTRAPTVSGVHQVGSELTADSGDWLDLPRYSIRTSYRRGLSAWQRASSSSGNGLSAIASNSSTYTPTPADHLQYIRINVTFWDNQGLASDAASPWVQVINTAPSIDQGDSLNVSSSEDNVPTPFALTLSASDIDENDLEWSITTNAGSGTASVNGGVVDYQPNDDYFGGDTFVVSVSDNFGGSDSITINVTINPENDAPRNETLPTISGEASIW